MWNGSGEAVGRCGDFWLLTLKETFRPCLKALVGTAWQNDAKHLGCVAVVVVVVVVAHCFPVKVDSCHSCHFVSAIQEGKLGVKERNKNNMFHSHLKVSHPNGMATIFNLWRWSIAATLKCCNTQMLVSLEREFASTYINDLTCCFSIWLPGIWFNVYMLNTEGGRRRV